MMTSAAARAVTMVALRVRVSKRVTFGSVWRSVALPWCAATRESLTSLKLCSVLMGLEAFAQLRAFANLARLDIVALELLVAEPDDDADHHSAAVSDTINALGRLRRLAFMRNCVIYPAVAAAAEFDSKPLRSPTRGPREATDADLPTWRPRLERLAVIRPGEKPDQAQATATTAPEALLYLAVRRPPRLRELKLERGSGEVVSIRDRDVPTQQLPPGWTTTFERRTRLSLTKSPVGSGEARRVGARVHPAA